MWKGHFVAVDAAKELKEKYPELNFVFLFVGGNNKIKFLERLKKRVRKNRVEENIIFAGNIPDMPAIYSIADVVLSTSVEPEAFGRVSVEAQSMGKPIIASNIGGSKETVLNKKTGFLYKHDDPRELAKSLNTVIQLSQEELKLMGNEGRKNVTKKFDVDIMCDSNLKEYKKLVKINASN